MSVIMPVLSTPRLRVRPFESRDLTVAHRLLEQDAWQTQWSLADRKGWLRWAELNHEMLAEANQPPYGARPPDSARLFVQEAGLFWALLSDHRDQGSATGAAQAVVEHLFSALHLRRVVATTEHDNKASQAVMRRLGMQIVGNPFLKPRWFQVPG